MKRHVIRVLSATFGRILVCVGILVGALAVTLFLASLHKPPAQAVQSEHVMPVEVKRVEPEDVPVMITGYGEIQTLNEVRIAPEVSGQVVEVHPRLEEGEVIPAGEVLFRIDPADYQSGKEQAEAQVSQREKTIVRLRTQYGIDTERLETLKRTRELSKKEFERKKELLEKDEVGTQSGVDAAEMQFNQANDMYDQLSQLVLLYPTSISEAESGLNAAKAQLDIASTALARTEVRAPFNARLKEVHLERGQYARPGEPVLVLADDSLLEISVPLDSRDARQWLQFKNGGATGGAPWFGELEPVRCKIRWTEEVDGHFWEGTLHRVQNFDEQTRTLTVAVRVTREEALSADGLPLVEGMFCAVEIPGKVMEKVFRLPRWAVTFEEKVYVAVDERLQVRTVKVLRSQDDDTFVREGLQAGEHVVVTRLVNPLPNTRLEFRPPMEPKS